MFFTRVGIFVASLMFVLGAIRTVFGVLIAFGTEDMENNRAASAMFLGAENSGEAIDQGIAALGMAIALGVLCEISKHVFHKTNSLRTDSEKEH